MTLLAEPDLTPDSATETEATVARNSATVAIWTLVSRLTGFARVFFIAAVLGPTHFGNLFQLANQLPWVVYELAAGSLLASLLVPSLVREEQFGRHGMQRLANSMLTLVIMVFAAASMLALLGGPLLLRLLSRSVEQGSRDDYISVGFALIALTAPQLIGYGIIAVATSCQNARGRFAFAAGAPAIENLIVIGAVALYASTAQPGAEVDAVATSGVVLLGAGSTLAVTVHCGLQWAAAHHAGITLRPVRRWRTPELATVLRLGPAAAATAALNGVRHLLLLTATGIVPGGIVAYNAAIGFLNLPIALGARPVATAQLPVLAQASPPEYGRLVRRGVSMAGLVVIPSGVAFVGLSGVLATGVGWGEMDSTYGRWLLAAAIGGIGLGTFGEGLYQLAAHAAYAARDAQPALRAMIVRVALTAVAVAGLWLSTDLPPVWIVGIAITAASVADVAGAAVAYNMVAPRQFPWKWTMATLAGSLAATAMATTVGVAGLARWADPPQATVLAAVTGALAVGIPMLIGARFHPSVRAMLGRQPDPGRVDPGPAELPPEQHHERQSGENQSRDGQLPTRYGPRRTVVTWTPDRSPFAALQLRYLADWMWRWLSSPKVFVAVVIATAAAIGLAGPVGLAIPLGVVLVVSVFRYPPLAAYVMFGLAPFVIGLDRGAYVPLLRPNEALLGLMVAIVAVRFIWDRKPLNIGITRVDVTIVVLALSASFIPLLVAVGRLKPVGTDDVLYAVTMWKLVVLYGLFRVVIRSPEQVRTALWVLISVAAVLGILAALDGRNVAGTAEWLYNYFPVEEGPADDGRGAATIGNAIGMGGYLVVAVAAAASMLIGGDRPRLALLACVGGCLIGAMGTGQVTSVIGLVVAVVALGLVTGTTMRLIMLAIPTSLIVAALMLPVIMARVDGFEPSLPSDTVRAISELPAQQQPAAFKELNPGSSWEVRWYNLEYYFLPSLKDPTNILLGVTPQARARAVEPYRDWVYIESGYLWLVWSGGIGLVGTFCAFIWVSGRSTWQVAKARWDPIGHAAAAAFAAVVAIAAIQAFDPHLTLRGTADVFYPVLALAQVASAGRAVFPREP